MNGNPYIRTDLATEKGAPLKEGIPSRHSEGFTFSTDELDHSIVRSALHITSPRGEERFEREMGRYITFGFEAVWLMEEQALSYLGDAVAKELSAMIREICPRCGKVLCVGLGNRDMTPDAIGPLAVRDIAVTRHIPNEKENAQAVEVSAIAPGVVGHTGIETAELIRGAVAHVQPDLVIAIDALAARNACRLARTVQLSDTGLHPGSGIGNTRMGLNRSTLGIPVIAMGVPMVVSSATLVFDALEQANIQEISPALEEVLKTGMDFFVSPKEADFACAKLASLLADAVNCALKV